MKTPLFFPVELDYIKDLKTPEEVLNALRGRSQEDMIIFFETGSEDETWVQNVGSTYIKVVLFWLTKQFASGLLSLDHAKRIAHSIQQNFHVVGSLLDEDVKFKVDDQFIPASSLMFGANSNFFNDLIKRERGHNIVLKDFSVALFQQIKDYIYTGSIEELWKGEAPAVLKLMRTASTLNMLPLEEYAANAYKKFINEKNIIENLSLASREGLQTLKDICCDFINKLQYGIRLYSFGYGELRVELTIVREEGWDILARIVKLITHIDSHQLATEDPQFVNFLKSITRLVGLDLSQSSNVLSDLIESLPPVTDFNLTNCIWLDDDQLKSIFLRCPNLITLNLKENAQLSYRAWGALSSLQRLGILDLEQCRSVGDDEFDLILTNSPGLVELSLSGCSSITSKHMGVIGKRCSQIKSLNLSACRMISETGFAEMAANTRGLTSLDVSYCGSISDQLLGQMMPQLSQLTYLNILGCFVADTFVENIQKERPSLKIKH